MRPTANKPSTRLKKDNTTPTAKAPNRKDVKAHKRPTEKLLTERLQNESRFKTTQGCTKVHLEPTGQNRT